MKVLWDLGYILDISWIHSRVQQSSYCPKLGFTRIFGHENYIDLIQMKH